MQAPQSDDAGTRAPRNLRPYSLSEKYQANHGWVVLSGIQALVRLPMLRRQLDASQGLNTAGFISGYRGSPLGGYDQQLWREQSRLQERQIVFKPAINEELAATAVWGTQQVNNFPGARHDGVFALWYGKGPGVDRCGDVFKHGNFFGTSPHGGVLALAGDDHAAKSSTMPNQSEFAFMDAEIPVLNPANVEEVLEFGVKGIALSRFAGLWIGMKTIADTMDSTATIPLDPARYETSLPPNVEIPAGGLNARLVDIPSAQEERHRHFRLPATQAFARLNDLDRVMIDPPRARFGILTTGKAYLHVRQALVDLGVSDHQARDLGIRILKVGLVWPLDSKTVRAFADGLEEILVVEERRDVLEHQLRAIAYDLPDGRRPRIVGKRDNQGRPLVPDLSDLSTECVALAPVSRLPMEWRTEHMSRYVEQASANTRKARDSQPLHSRAPFFCSGCPHNTSTRLPEGSRAFAGIGCHFLVQWMNRRSESCTQMGGEGVPWMGQSPFSTEQHVFANLGDGTYFHSGSLAIRQAIAAKLNITYKILYNGAVAMTGGQPVDGELSLPKLISQLEAEGVRKIALVSDDPSAHRADPNLPGWVAIYHRDKLDTVQVVLRNHAGCSVLIYDQLCATEARRQRKRGVLKAAARRVFINERVCEGCGDCSVQSNCLSVTPVETEFGTKRRIDQSTCNQDLSCVRGHCPSFVSVEGGSLRRRLDSPRAVDRLPIPSLPPLDAEPYNILLAGIGGQGVTTLSQVMAVAAHLESKSVRVLDQLGMAQKGGGVLAHLRIGGREHSIFSPRIGAGQAHLVLTSDLIAAHGHSVLYACGTGRTAVVADSHLMPSGEFVLNNGVQYDLEGMLAAVRGQCRDLVQVAAHAAVTSAFADSVFVNIYLLGFAYQRGLVPLGGEAIERAIALNSVAVKENLAAFRLGREAALGKVQANAASTGTSAMSQNLAEMVAIRVRELTAYGGKKYARRYAEFVERVRVVERKATPGQDDLSRAVARSLYKLMAYKDEYEVARLHSSQEFIAQLREQLDGDFRLVFHLAPPIFTKLTGRSSKWNVGPWAVPLLRILARFRFLRGTSFDPFGYLPERRTERALITSYRDGLIRLLPRISTATYPFIVEYAELPGSIRGFGHIKDASISAARMRAKQIEEQVLAASDGKADAATQTRPHGGSGAAKFA